MLQPAPPVDRPNATLAAFVAMAFAVVGLTGLFATFAAPLPLERALAREAVLDEMMAAARGPDYASAYDRLRPLLGDSGAALVPGPDLEGRILAERAAMRARLTRDAEVTAVRLRWLVCVVTVMAALFGLAMMGVGRRRG